jgi:glycosyltransferase involved in cell wall biosynthesis
MSNITGIMIDSRSEVHPDWVNLSLNSIRKAEELYPLEKLIVVKNTDRKKTIGQCWNEALQYVETEWTMFFADDDWITPDFLFVYHYWTTRKETNRSVAIQSHMTVYNETEKGDVYNTLERCHTGMWRTEYLREHPFNEKLEKGIDREYVEECDKRGDFRLVIHYYHGYHYRQHEDYSCAGKIRLIKESGDLYFNARYPIFIQPVTERLKKNYTVTLDNHPFDPQVAKGAKVMWCDWADENAFNISEYDNGVPKILRLHAYEAFGSMIHYIDFDKFEKVIFVAKHIKDYVERQIKKKLKNAVVIPNGVNVSDYYIPDDKEKNNKIAWAGQIGRKKGALLLLFLAEHFPDYEFHIAGKYDEKDIAELFHQRMPDNMFIHPYSYNIKEFFKDKTYYLNTSPREGCPITPLQAMASGLKPIIYKWSGAEDYMPSYWLFKDVNEFDMILKGEYDPWRYREYVENNYNFNVMYDKFVEIINVSYKSADLHQNKDTYPGRNVHAIG